MVYHTMYYVENKYNFNQTCYFKNNSKMSFKFETFDTEI